MRRYLNFLLLFIFIILANYSHSQSLIGTQSNYAGSKSTLMNPALMTTSYLYSDFSLANIGLSVFNDYAYMKGADFSKLLFNSEHPVPTYQLGDYVFNFMLYDKENKRYNVKNIYESLDLNILSFMYNIADKHAVAFALNGRVYTSGTDIPWEIPEILTFGLEDNDQYYQHYSSSGTNISTLEWMEVAASYSVKLYERYRHRVDVGLSAKYLLGYSAVVGNINELDYQIFSEDTIVVNKFNADLAYSLPVNYNEPFSSSLLFDESMMRGNGFAIDLGFVYSHKKEISVTRKRLIAPCMQPVLDYSWKIGVSLMDLGYINFKNNALNNSFDYYGNLIFDQDDFNNITSLNMLINTLSAIYYEGDNTASVTGNTFRIGLPTTLRIQFDYNLHDNFYVNATFIHPIKLFEYSVEVTPQILFEPRFESEYLEFAMPFTLRNYKQLHIGASARLGFVTIGTHNIASYLGLGNANGVDVYVSFKLNFRKGSCGEDKFDACWSADFGNKRR